MKKRYWGIRRIQKPVLLCCSLWLLWGMDASAEVKISSQGELGIEARLFTGGGEGDQGNVSGIGRLSLSGKSKPFKFKFRGFIRHDGVDRTRSAIFPEEAWVEYREKGLRFRAGYQLLNWTATEAFHPADVINSRYFDGNVQNPEKLGELILSLRLKIGNGNIEGFLMPLFTEPILPSTQSRFRFSPFGSEVTNTLILDRDGELTETKVHPNWGVRLSQTLGKADVSMHVLQQTDKSLPQVRFESLPPTSPPNLVFQQVTQVGGTYQQALGTFLLKFEGAYRWFVDSNDPTFAGLSDFGLVAGGVEWGFGHESGGESTFLLEGQSIFGQGDADLTFFLFERDVLLGYRYAHGDESDQSLTLSSIVDLDDPEQIFGNAEYGRRLGDSWRLSAGFRLIRYPASEDSAPVGPENLNNANYVYTTLLRYF